MQLSNIKYHNIIFANDKDIEKIVFDKENQELKEKCDVGVVFGGISMIPNRVEQAISLYERGQIDRILVSGGIGYLNTDRKNLEADKLQSYLLNKGIPKNDILVENKSRNTHENVKFFLDVLKKEYTLKSTKLALISSDFHIRRCLALASSYFDREKLYGSGVKDGITDIDNWTSSLYGKRLILTEALLLCYYTKQKIINDIDIKNLNLKMK